MFKVLDVIDSKYRGSSFKNKEEASNFICWLIYLTNKTTSIKIDKTNFEVIEELDV